MTTKVYEVKRQAGSRQFGVFKNGVLVEGGFFDLTAAHEALDELVNDAAVDAWKAQAHHGFSNGDSGAS